MSVLETSTFENLLIEHPTMSVYAGRFLPGGVRGSDPEPAEAAQVANVRRPREIRLAEFLPVNLLDRNSRQEQQLAVRQHGRSITPNKIDRANRSVHFEASSKKNYRKKRMRALNAGTSDRKGQ